MARIYVSSTYEDLKEYREAVRQAIRKLDQVDVAMEYYVAEPMRPLDKCLEDVRRSDIYIGIFAWRYGYIPPGSELSITEQEFRQAVKFEKPILCFLLDESAAWPEVYKETGPAGERVRALRAELKEHYLRGSFSSPEGLAMEVASAIVKLTQFTRTPLDREREHRLMKIWTNSDRRFERNRARQALVNMGSSRYASAIKEQVLKYLGGPQSDLDELVFYLQELLQVCENSNEAMPILVDLLQGPNSRSAAVFQIGELGLRGKTIKPDVVREILKLAQDPEPYVRKEVAHTLGKIRHSASVLPEVIECLNILSQDPTPEVQEKAIESLRLVS